MHEEMLDEPRGHEARTLAVLLIVVVGVTAAVVAPVSYLNPLPSPTRPQTGIADTVLLSSHHTSLTPVQRYVILF